MIKELKFWLADFIPYSAESWIGLLETTNTMYWPYSSVLAIVFGFIFIAITTRGRWMLRATILMLAISWGWCGLVFLRMHYANLTWVANYIFILFLIQGVLILLHINAKVLDSAISPFNHSFFKPQIVVAVFFLLPVIQWLFDYDISSLSWLALNPDATAFGSMIILYLIGLNARILLVIPLLWFVYSLSVNWPLGLIPETVNAVLGFGFALFIWLTHSRKHPYQD